MAFGDSIAYVNINNAAHILWASNSSDEASAMLPPDYLTLFNSLVANPVNVTANPDGTYNQTMVPLPTGGGMDCTTDPACTPTANYTAVPTETPEPSTALLLGMGLIAVSLYSKRRRQNRQVV